MTGTAKVAGRFTGAFFGILLVLPIGTANAADSCGEVVSLPASGASTLKYSLGRPEAGTVPRGVFVALAGGGGHVDLSDNGCARKLAGNTLIRISPELRMRGFWTAIVDAPSDHHGNDGLGGFRTAPRHAEEVGAVIRDIRRRTGLPVLLAGSSRGTISAVNVVTRASGDSAPDRVMLFSPVTQGREGGYKAWVAQTVFDLPLEDIKSPLMVVTHRGDRCIRTPPGKAHEILDRMPGTHHRLVQMEGGSNADSKLGGVKACAGRLPHGFGGLDNEVMALIETFMAETH